MVHRKSEMVVAGRVTLRDTDSAPQENQRRVAQIHTLTIRLGSEKKSGYTTINQRLRGKPSSVKESA